VVGAGTVPYVGGIDEAISSGDRVEYLGAGVFDNLIVRGDIGVVRRVGNGWVHALWPRCEGVHSVPIDHVRVVASS
jgi:hypothetical protein